MAYLYGASIQGIQGFIFESNELKTIVGASEIIKSFDNINFVKDYNVTEVLLQAAGNIRLKIENLVDVSQLANSFPKYIMQQAYGITVSQAVVDISKYNIIQEAREELEKRLKMQRNKVSLPLDKSISILSNAPKSARPSFKKEDKAISKGTHQKLERYEEVKASSNNAGKLISEISKLSNRKNKIEFAPMYYEICYYITEKSDQR